MAIAGNGDVDVSEACKQMLDRRCAAPGSYLAVTGPGYSGSSFVPLALPALQRSDDNLVFNSGWAPAFVVSRERARELGLEPPAGQRQG